jgi:hypothetical protein
MANLLETIKRNSESKQKIDELEKLIIGQYEVFAGLQKLMDYDKLCKYRQSLVDQSKIIEDMLKVYDIPNQIKIKIKNNQLINIVLPTFNTKNSELVQYYGKMINNYLLETDEKYKQTLFNTSMSLENTSYPIYKNNNNRMYSQYEHGTILWNVYMYMQNVLIPACKCHRSEFAKIYSDTKQILMHDPLLCELCKQLKQDSYIPYSLFKNHNNQDFHINALQLNGLCNSQITYKHATVDDGIQILNPDYSTRNIFSKLFTLKSYELLLNTLSFNGMHAEVFEDPFKNYINVTLDKTIKYKYEIKIYRIYEDIYYDFHTIEPKNIDIENVWHISDAIDDGCSKYNDDKIQLFIYKTQL